MKLRIVQFWCEIILVISNGTRVHTCDVKSNSRDFQITSIILDQIALHSVQLPLYRTLYCLMLMLVCH